MSWEIIATLLPNGHPYGKPMPGRSSNTNNGQNDVRFTSHEYDEEFGMDLVYAGARYLDPELGIWLSIDPLAAKFPEWSPYSYTVGNPLRFIDPDGMDTVYYDNKGNETNRIKSKENVGYVNIDGKTQRLEGDGLNWVGFMEHVNKGTIKFWKVSDNKKFNFRSSLAVTLSDAMDAAVSDGDISSIHITSTSRPDDADSKHSESPSGALDIGAINGEAGADNYRISNNWRRLSYTFHKYLSNSSSFNAKSTKILNWHGYTEQGKFKNYTNHQLGSIQHGHMNHIHMSQ